MLCVLSLTWTARTQLMPGFHISAWDTSSLDTEFSMKLTLCNVWLAVFNSCVCRWVFPLKSLCAVLWLQTMFSCSSQRIQHFRHLSARTTTCACVTVSRMCRTCLDRLMVKYLLLLMIHFAIALCGWVGQVCKWALSMRVYIAE